MVVIEDSSMLNMSLNCAHHHSSNRSIQKIAQYTYTQSIFNDLLMTEENVSCSTAFGLAYIICPPHHLEKLKMNVLLYHDLRILLTYRSYKGWIQILSLYGHCWQQT
jgi:hypothetical protein